MYNPFSRKAPKPNKQKDYETLGKQVMALYDALNPDRFGLYRSAFLRGVFTGVGTVVGATLIIALLAGVLLMFHRVPLIGPISDHVRNTLENRPK